MATPSSLAGRRILIAEDEPLVAVLIEDILDELGCNFIGSFACVADAFEAATTSELDFALLDVLLDGEAIYPVAELLEQRKVPFLLMTGYGASGVPSDYPDWPWISKPFRLEELARRIQEILN